MFGQGETVKVAACMVAFTFAVSALIFRAYWDRKYSFRWEKKALVPRLVGLGVGFLLVVLYYLFFRR